MTAFEMGDTEETEPDQLLSALLDGELRPIKNADKPTLKLAAANEV